MLVTHWTRYILFLRRKRRDLANAGFEPVSETGSPLWEFQRGSRQSHRITATAVDPDGQHLWIKVSPQDD